MSLSESLAAKGGSVGADFEVQKLKDLVKKLERQNQHLRHKTGKLSYARQGSESSEGDSSTDKKLSLVNDVQHDLVVDDRELEEELKKLDTADDTSWLYVSPKSKHLEGRNFLQEWVREELDGPSTPQIESAKKKFLKRLETPYGYEFFKAESAALEASPKLKTIEKCKETSNIISEINGSHATYEASQPPVERQLFSQRDQDDAPYEMDRHYQGSWQSRRHRHSHHDEKVHHMPLPSHTMTSAHGLIPSSSVSKNRQRSPSPRSRNMKGNPERTRTPTRSYSPAVRGESPSRRSQLKSITPSERTPRAPRSNSPSTPVRGSNLRQSLPNMPRGRSSSPHTPIPEVSSSFDGRPTSATSRLRMPSGLPRSQSPYSNNEQIKPANNARQLRPPTRSLKYSNRSTYDPTVDSIPPSTSASNLPTARSLTPRRALPRPSQTSRSSSAASSKKSDSVRKSLTSPSIGSDHYQRDAYSNSPCNSESGNSDVWKDGEFF